MDRRRNDHSAAGGQEAAAPRLPDSFGAIDRRHFLAVMPWLGAGAAGALLAGETGEATAGITEGGDPCGDLLQDPQAPPGPITLDDLESAQRMFGLEFTDEENRQMLRNVNNNLRLYESLRGIDVPLDTEPALTFDPRPHGFQMPAGESSFSLRRPDEGGFPATDRELAFLPVSRLAQLVRGRQVSPVELTRFYLDRLQRFDSTLYCVISYTEERALAQARQAEQEIIAGRWRGPLHGIPWGAKDLLAVRGTRTTWGAKPYEEQVIDVDATVVDRLDRAGAVLVAKLTLGALAMGDYWYGGRTRSPWNPQRGSSGSSAGPAAATAGGLVGFSIGSETLGSIMSPSSACGTVGLRPTYGRVSRHGAMALSWSMDKLGPLCRGVEDAALVFDAIRGSDGFDPTVVDAPFRWQRPRRLREMKIGYLPAEFENPRTSEGRRRVYAEALEVFRGLGAQLEPIELPDLPLGPIRLVLSVEASAAFDDLVRSGRVRELVRQQGGSWPNSFRTHRMVPAVEFIRAQRARRLLMQRTDELMRDLDAFLSPNNSASLTLTNLTGHPALAVPCGFEAPSTPTVLMITGRLYKEDTILDIGWQYEQATEWHRMHPDLSDLEEGR